MIIQKSNIRKIDNYLKGIEDGDTIIVSIPYRDELRDTIIQCGFSTELEPGERVLPSPIGPVTRFNSEGKYIIHKDQPKEDAYRLTEWTWNEYHGPYDTVERSGIVEVPYKRYPRTYIDPPSIELNIVVNNDGTLLVVSNPIDYIKENEDNLLFTINIFLEIFKECHLLNIEMQELIRTPTIRLNWEILPRGMRPWEEQRQMISSIIDQQPEGNQKVINKRFQTINEHQPDFTAVGRAGFSGYIIFGFSEKNLYVLECLMVNNATYIIDNNWELLSSLTKAEILNNNLHRDRIIHRKSWFENINRILNE